MKRKTPKSNVTKKNSFSKFYWALIELFCVAAIVVPTTVCLGKSSSTVDKYLSRNKFVNISENDVGQKPSRKLIINSFIYWLGYEMDNKDTKFSYNFAKYNFYWTKTYIIEDVRQIASAKMFFLGDTIEFNLITTVWTSDNMSNTNSSNMFIRARDTVIDNSLKTEAKNFDIVFKDIKGKESLRINIPTYDISGKVIWPEK